MIVKPTLAAVVLTSVSISFSLGGVFAAAPPPVVPPPGIHMTRVGDPVQTTSINAAHVGQNHVYEVLNGTPPRLLQIRPDGTITASATLAHGYNAWAVAEGRNGTIYTGTTSNTSADVGYLWAWKPGGGPAHVVAQIPHTVTIWSIAVDPATGIVWVGSTSGLSSYDPQTRHLADYGRLVPGETDVHQVTANGGLVYAGLTPHAAVVMFDAATHAVQPLQADDHTSGIKGIVADALGVTIVWASGDLYRYQGGVKVGQLNSAQTLPVVIGNQRYTFIAGGTIDQGFYRGYPSPIPPAHSYPLALGSARYLPVVGAGSISGQLIGVLNDGDFVSANPGTWAMSLVTPKVTNTSPGVIHALYADAAGSLWSSVYLGGEVTRVLGHTFQRYPAAQVDSFASYGGVLYMGSYPGAYLMAYNEAQPWSATNPTIIGRVQYPESPDQARAFALAVGPHGVYMGTVPDGGSLSGNLGYYDPKTRHFQVFNSPVSGQAITSLAYTPSGMLVGTTTAFGGGGVQPVDRSARVFIWNPATQRLVASLRPLPDIPVLGGLVVTPQGIYGASPRAIFRLDPKTLKVLGTRIINSSANTGQWSSLTHMLTWHGKLFLLTDGQLYEINPTTLAATKLFYGAEQAAVDGNVLYLSYHNSVQLVKVPLPLLTAKNCLYPNGYIAWMDAHPDQIP